MSDRNTPNIFGILLANMHIEKSDIVNSSDGFYMVNKSISDILSTKDIFDFIDSSGERYRCNRFFDDWFLYAVPNDTDYTYSLLKLREQEYDVKDGTPADGDTPGVTISFISFDCKILINCLTEPTDENRKKLNFEINRVVAYRGQKHHKALKKYFTNPNSQGSYLVADIYTRTIASYAENGCLKVPERYKKIVKQSKAFKFIGKFSRLPHFVESLNKEAGCTLCDNEKIFIKNRDALTVHESLAILATHTGNTSFYSFAAEVEYHARFLIPLAKIRIPFSRKTIYDSAIRADMTVGNTKFDGLIPFYRLNSKIVKRQYAAHRILKI